MKTPARRAHLAYERVAGDIAARIAAGELRPGARLVAGDGGPLRVAVGVAVTGGRVTF